jgi:hypothetical protein
MNLVDIEAKKTVLESQKKAVLDRVNLALAPLQAQVNRLEGESNKLVIQATGEIGQLDGRLAQLEELAVDLRAVLEAKDASTVANPEAVGLIPTVASN